MQKKKGKKAELNVFHLDTKQTIQRLTGCIQGSPLEIIRHHLYSCVWRRVIKYPSRAIALSVFL